MAEHAYSIKPTDSVSLILASNFIEGIRNPHVINKLRCFQIKNLKEIFGHVIHKDQKQKIRALDFRESPKPVAILNCDINVIKGNNCFKCGSDIHFIKGCPLNKGNSNTHQRKHYNDQSNTNFNSTPDIAIDLLTKLFNNLIEQLRQLNPARNISSNTHMNHKGHDKYNPRQTFYSSDHRQHSRGQKHQNNDHRQGKEYYHRKEYKHHKGHYNKHNKGEHSKVNEIESCSECSSECSDISNYEDHPNDQDPPTPDSPEN